MAQSKVIEMVDSLKASTKEKTTESKKEFVMEL